MKKNIPIIFFENIVILPGNEIKLLLDDKDTKLAINISKIFHDNFLVIGTKIDGELLQIAVFAKIISERTFKDEKQELILKVIKRVSIITLLDSEETREAVIENIEIPEIDIKTSEDIRKEVSTKINKVTLAPYIRTQAVDNILSNIDDISVFIDASYSIIEKNPLKLKEFLLLPDTMSRYRVLSKTLDTKQAFTEVEREIDTKVREKLDLTQKEYLLREKIKAIKEELGEDGENEATILRSRMEDAKLPKHIHERVSFEIKKYEQLPPTSPEHQIVRNYVEWLLTLPWNIKTKDNLSLNKVKQKLDESHSALEKVKMRILEHLAIMKNSKKLDMPIICLVGPPGVGKTTLVSSIAKALNKEFAKISVGGISDEAELVGHRRAYVGASPGRIITAIKKCKSNNPIFLIDEIDKMSKGYRGDPSNILLEILDPEQNKEFSDNYIEEAFDLSNVFFIATANYIEEIPHALYDRLEIINLAGYTEFEKLEIAKNYLVPKNKSKVKGFDLDLSDDVILKIIREYTKESGVRELERQIAKIIRKVVLEKELNKKEIKKINEKVLEELLGKPIYVQSKLNFKKEIGVVNGLAYTYYGGTVLPIEVNIFEGKGNLVLTGSLGNVMKESAQIALSYIKSNHKKFDIKIEVIKENDIHIHFPEGAIKKDGPSAGIAVTSALISALSKKKVRKDIAMTGEITLRGEVIPIGGLKEKSTGALRSGINKIIIPSKNKKDLADLEEELIKGIKYYPVERYEEVYDILFKEGEEQ